MHSTEIIQIPRDLAADPRAADLACSGSDVTRRLFRERWPQRRSYLTEHILSGRTTSSRLYSFSFNKINLIPFKF